jgi:hypothetical protein
VLTVAVQLGTTTKLSQRSDLAGALTQDRAESACILWH